MKYYTAKLVIKEKGKLYHPDTGGDEEEFMRIRKAIETGMAQ